MSKAKKPKLSAADQVAVLSSLGQTAAAHLVGITPRSLRDRRDVPRNENGTYNARALVEWLEAQTIDAMDAGAETSPALEEYRRARAGQEQLKLREMLGTRAHVDILKQGLRRFFDGFRRTAESLRRRFGNEAVDIFEHGRQEALAGVLEWFQSLPPTSYEKDRLDDDEPTNEE